METYHRDKVRRTGITDKFCRTSLALGAAAAVGGTISWHHGKPNSDASSKARSLRCRRRYRVGPSIAASGRACPQSRRSQHDYVPPGFATDSWPSDSGTICLQVHGFYTTPTSNGIVWTTIGCEIVLWGSSRTRIEKDATTPKFRDAARHLPRYSS